MSSLKRLLSIIAVLAAAGAGGGVLSASAEPSFQGPQKCADCHKSEMAVWQKTKHATIFREIHRHPSVKAIVTAAGGDANMRRNTVCTQCHYTMVTEAGKPPAATNGPSCESCHGASSDWMPIHNSRAAKPERIQKASAAGMIWPNQLYAIATNCLSCHGLARPDIPPDTFAKMIDAGHPAGTEFELVRYLEGSVRHRFYPPDVSKNQEMNPAELSRTFVTGHAAALVKVTSVQGKVNNAKYQETLKKIETNARAALDAVKGQLPEAAAVLAQPTEANGRKLADAIANKDLSAQVSRLLPAKNTYK
jgi:hypothetical protein